MVTEDFVRSFLKEYKGVNPKTVVPYSFVGPYDQTKEYFYVHGATLSSQTNADGSWPYVFDGKQAYFGDVLVTMQMGENATDYIELADGQKSIIYQDAVTTTGYTGLNIIPFEFKNVFFDNMVFRSDGNSCLYFAGWRVTF